LHQSPIVYADAEGVIRLWNRGATRIFGFAEAEALGCSLDIISVAMFWPGHINDAGGIRRQFHHIIDIAPTRLVDPKEAKALLDEVRTGLSAGGRWIRTSGSSQGGGGRTPSIS